MGIMAPIARMFLREHKHKPITGDMLLVGRQTVPMTIDEARSMLRSEGVAERLDFDETADWVFDKSTRAGEGKTYISDLGFFALFSDAKIRTLDVTDYEDAEIVHDMHQPVPEELHGAFDFIWNGSCLDNMFDPAMAMRNTGRMLRPGGRIVGLEMATPHFDAYVTYSQSWFFDYFAVNNFSDCKVYTCAFDPKKIFSGPYHLFRPGSYESISHQFPRKLVSQKLALISFFVAEAGSDSTWEKMPIQEQYRPDHEVYKAAYERFSANSRPVMAFKPTFASRFMRKSRHVDYLGVVSGV